MFYSKWDLFHIDRDRLGETARGFRATGAAARDGATCVSFPYWRYRFWCSLARVTTIKAAREDRLDAQGRWDRVAVGRAAPRPVEQAARAGLRPVARGE